MISNANIDDEINMVGNARVSVFRTGFLTPKARLIFAKMRQAFNITLILHCLNLEYYICIETDASDYAIKGILSQLILKGLGQLYQVVFFSQKMIPVDIQYYTYNDELLVIIEAFKT